MFPILWIVVAVGTAFALVALSARRIRSQLPALELPPGETLPATRLQRLATRCLAGSAALTVIGAGIITVVGPQRFYDDDGVRLPVTLLMLVALAVGALPAMLAPRWTAADLDERDRVILNGASGAQAGAMLVTLAVWMVGLTETFRSAGGVPTLYLNLIFWSCALVGLLSWLASVVMAYRRS